MAKSSKIRVMISSRCNDRFPLSSKSGLNLSELRVKLKQDIEAASVLGERPYEVWIHERATEDLELDAWDECLRQAREVRRLHCTIQRSCGVDEPARR